MKLIKNVKIYTGEKIIENGYIRFQEKICEVDSMDHYVVVEDDEDLNYDKMTVVPGFIDVHSHGGYGLDNMDATADEIDSMVKKMAENEGITSYFCTTMTQSNEKIELALENIKIASEKNRIIKGIHLEGPFISKKYKGAQDEQYILAPDKKIIENWNEISGGLIKVITYAPENSNEEFENYCKANNIILSAGHSDATFAKLKEDKPMHITHLYNAQRGLNHREPGVTGYGLLDKCVMTELICDGIHIVPEMIKMAYLLKGSDGIELITDSMRGKGMPEGESELGGQQVYIKDGTARLADGTIAGSVLTYIGAFKNIIKFAGAGIEDAVKMSSVNQAKEFGLSQKGKIKNKKDADLVVLDNELNLIQTISYGECLKKR